MSQMIKCPACNADISSAAAACPQCGHPMKRQGNPNQANAGCAVLLLLALGTFIYSIVHESTAPKQSPAQPAASANAQTEDALSLDACAAATSAVKAKLLAPASADVHCGKITSNPEHTKFGVVGYVDSQNAFGAQLRKKFVVLLSKKPGVPDMVATKVGVE